MPRTPFRGSVPDDRLYDPDHDMWVRVMEAGVEVGATAFGDREYPVTSVRDLAGLLGRQRGKALKIAILRGTDDLIGTLDVRGADKR